MKVGGWLEGEVGDAIPDEESEAGWKQSRRIARSDESRSRVKKVKLEGSMAGASRRSGSESKTGRLTPAQAGGWPEGAAGRFNVRRRVGSWSEGEAGGAVFGASRS